MDSVVLHSRFNASDIVFQPITKTAKGSKIVYLNFPGGKKIQVQTPVMSAPFGISSFTDAATGVSSYSLDASFRGADNDPKIAGFLAKMKELDEVVIDAAVKNSADWFGKSMSKDVVANLTRSIVKEPSDPKYASTIKFKIGNGFGPDSTFYDESHNEVDKDYVTKGSTFRAIIELGSVWQVNRSFGVTWRLVQCAVVSRPDQGIQGFAMLEDDDE